MNYGFISILAAWVQSDSSTTTFSSTRKAGHRHRRCRRRHCARRGTRYLNAAEPRRREGWEREGVHRGTRHLRAAEAKKGMLLRGEPDASPTPGKVQAQHINTCVPPSPVACPELPPSPRPPRFLHRRFLHRCSGGRKRYAAARGDPDASPSPHTRALR